MPNFRAAYIARLFITLHLPCVCSHYASQYVPDITINELLVDEMTEEEKEQWCQSDPSGTFKYNQLTRRVSST